MNKDLDVIFVGHAQSRNIFTLNMSPALKAHCLGQEMCKCLTGFPTSYVNNIFPLFPLTFICQRAERPALWLPDSRRSQDDPVLW